MKTETVSYSQFGSVQLQLLPSHTVLTSNTKNWNKDMTSVTLDTSSKKRARYKFKPSKSFLKNTNKTNNRNTNRKRIFGGLTRQPTVTIAPHTTQRSNWREPNSTRNNSFNMSTNYKHKESSFITKLDHDLTKNCDHLNASTDCENKVISKNGKQVLFSIDTLLEIVFYLNYKELICIRRVHRVFNKELYFKFEILPSINIYNNDNNDKNDKNDTIYKIHFKYHNYRIKYVLETILSPSLINIAMWWIQIQNIHMNGQWGILFGKHNNNNNDKNDNIDTIVNNKNLVYLADIIFNLKMLRVHCPEQHSRIKKFKNEEFDNGNNGKIMEKKQPMCEISKQLQSFDIHTRMGQIATNLDIESLILGSYYNILPIARLLKRLMREKNEFINKVQFVSNQIETKGIGRQGCLRDCLTYFWIECLGPKFSKNVLQDCRYIQTKDIYQTKGRFAIFSQLSFTGDFDYYTNFVDNILMKMDNNNDNDNNNDIDNTYGMMMNGMLPMFALHLRLDLLKSLKYNCDYCYNINHGLPFLTILFAAYPNILQQFKFYSKEKLGIYDNCIFPDCDDNDNDWKLRLNFLYNLCYSSRFHVALRYYSQGRNSTSHQEQYSFGMRWLQRLYGNFDVFVKTWNLAQLNLATQKEIHESYKLIIQMLFGLNDKLVYYDETCNDWKVFKCLIKTADSFVDMMPKCNDDVFSMYNIVLKQRHGIEREILQELERPVFHLHQHQQHQMSFDVKFDAVSNLITFLLDMFDLDV